MFQRVTLLSLLSVAVGLAQIRVGIVGTDTSHSTEFTRMLNDPTHPKHVSGAKVVAAWKGGSQDLPSSRDRVEGYAKELREKWQVEFVSNIGDICPKVDAILLESVDGRAHLAQAKEVFRCGKPVFIDKPLASTLKDARAIAALAKANNVPWFSSSALRFDRLATDMKAPDAIGAIAWGPGPTDATHELEMSWYAIHAVEILYALMGKGCQEVTFTAGRDSDDVSCVWKNGVVGTVRTLRPYGAFG
ncbi:MAG TPA: Gfo/Idh/MocA family oxidoreductase, partial [Bryobacteraceae bacterium]|nr:Gfo/Idh/MocA family oxidoreductase [Bryobacteraceae bacterium]